MATFSNDAIPADDGNEAFIWPAMKKLAIKAVNLPPYALFFARVLVDNSELSILKV